MRKLQDLKPNFLILGAKEYPLGAGAKEDVFASGGMEVYTEQLAQLLAKRGVKVTVITRKFAHQAAREARNGVEVRRVGWLKGFLLRNPSFNLNALREIFLLPRRGYTVIVANGVIATLVGTAAAWFKKISGERVKILARPAGIAWVQPQYNFMVKSALLMLETTAYALADAVVFLSQQEKEQFQNKMGFLPKRHVIIPTGVDPQRFKSAAGAQVRKQLGVKKDGKLIVFVGRLIEVKGLKYLIAAMREVDAKLAIVGSGPLKEKLAQQAAAAGVSNKIVFIKTANVPDYLNAADAFVLPSLSEGLPIALLEAMAAGRASVVTDIGLPVRDGKEALVVPPKNPAALAKALNKLLEDTGLRKRLGANALSLVRKEFNWDNAVNAYIRLAEELAR